MKGCFKKPLRMARFLSLAMSHFRLFHFRFLAASSVIPGIEGRDFKTLSG